MPNTLIIVGAGASVDCLSPANRRLLDASRKDLNDERLRERTVLSNQMRHEPPLTTNLVESLQSDGKGCARLLAAIELRKEAAQSSGDPFDFESTLRKLFLEVGDKMDEEFTALRNTLAARMLKADGIGSRFETLYTALFGRLSTTRLAEDRSFLVLSLNYDRLAEFAITNRSGFDELDDYTRGPQLRLYQPHGSCMWEVSQTDDFASITDITPRHGCSTEWIQTKQGHLGSVAALALPMSGDTEGKMAWPESHYKSLLAELPHVDELIVIGWRGADEHIVELVAAHIGPIEVVHLVANSAPGGDAMEANLSTIIPSGAAVEKVEGGFRNYIERDDSPLKALYPL